MYVDIPVRLYVYIPVDSGVHCIGICIKYGLYLVYYMYVVK